MTSITNSRRGSPRRSALAVAAAALLAGGCSARVAEPAGQPVADPAALAAEAARATAPAAPRQLSFAWTLDESGSRVRGRGVARVAPPERARLDLFGPRNESYLSAALVADELRLPGGAAPAVALPSPALLWGSVGVVRPPAGATLLGATRDDSTAVVRYRGPAGEEFRYRLRDAAQGLRLEQLERIGSGGVLETVTLERDAAGALQRTRYRDWSAFRDLTLDLESSQDVDAFPESIWRP